MAIGLLVLAVSIACDNADAEWIEVDHSEIQTTYADPASIEVSGNRISMWLLSSYKTPRRYEDKKFLSVKTQYEYDCGGEQFRMLEYSLRAGKTGEGEELHGETSVDKWKRVAKGSADESLWKKVCDPSAGWSKVGESDAMIVYANPYTVRKKGGRARMWELFDFKSAQMKGEGKRYLSIKHQAEYDCKAKQYRTLEVAYHAENMGRGKEVADDDKTQRWDPITTGSADELFWKMACGGV